MLVDIATIQRQHLAPNENVMRTDHAIRYIAGCPDCGNDAEWRDVLVSIHNPNAAMRQVVQNELNCSYCGIQESV